MSSITGKNLRESMDRWVSRRNDVLAGQYIAFARYAWNGTHNENYLQAEAADAAVIRGGLVGESGELAEEIKKGIRSRGMKWKPQDLVLEIGDVFFYLTQAALRHGNNGDTDLMARVRALIELWRCQPSGHEATLRLLEERLPFVAGSNYADAALHLKLLYLAEDVALAAAQLAISIRRSSLDHPDGPSFDDVTLMRAMGKLEEICLVLGVGFRDLFVLNGAKIVERRVEFWRDNDAPRDAFARMVDAVDPFDLEIELP